MPIDIPMLILEVEEGEVPEAVMLDLASLAAVVVAIDISMMVVQNNGLC